MNEKLEFKTWKHLTWDQSDRVLSVAEEEEEEESVSVTVHCDLEYICLHPAD